METVERDYSPKGVKFHYIYKSLAHPETNGYITPFTLDERLMHVAEAERKIGSRITWLCDTMDNDIKHALGDAPNSEFVIDPDGKIVVARRWSRPDELRADLAEFVGAVEPATTIDEVGMTRLEPPKTAAKGVVPRLELPERMTPVNVRPLNDPLSLAVVSEPYYVKLRAEADNDLLNDGSGQLYLGFFLDPLYKVHWNNKVMPIQYTVEVAKGVDVTSASGKGPDVETAADADPREFLVEVSGVSDEPIAVTVKYFACDDAETFCKPVTQRYEVVLQRDRDGGSRRSGRRGPPGGSPVAGDRGDFMRRIPLMASLDANRDGSLSSDEIAAASDVLLSLDSNEDGELTSDELRPDYGGFSSRERDGRRPSGGRRPTDTSHQRSQRLKRAVALFREHDDNRDGKIDEDEAATAENKRLRDADADGDGLITLRELIDRLKRAPSGRN